MSKDIEQKPDMLDAALLLFEDEAIAWGEECATDRQLSGQTLGDAKELRRARTALHTATEQYATERVIAELEQLLTREWSIDANDLRRYIIERQATLRGGITNE